MNRILEKKSIIVAPTDYIVGTGGSYGLIPIEDITQGDTDGTREGNIIHVQWIEHRFAVYDSVLAIVRCLVFIDRQSNGTTPGATDVLASLSPMATLNTTNVIGIGGSRFKILLDETVVVNPEISGVVKWSSIHRKVYKLGMPVTYLASTGAATDVGTNNVWCLYVANNATASVRHSCQVHFTDN